MANALGRKLPPNDPDLPRILRGVSANTLAPVGARVGPIPDRVGPAPVGRASMRSNPPSVIGRG